MNEMFKIDNSFVKYINAAFGPDEMVNSVSVEITIETNKKIHYLLEKIVKKSV